MAIEGGQRSCGAHELICARKVSPEVLGFLSTIAVFSLLMILLFLYLNNKLSLDSASHLSYLGFKHQKSKDLKVQVIMNS
ncbi:synaptotagmin-14-like isoform X4 [Arapaima gigas]